MTYKITVTHSERFLWGWKLQEEDGGYSYYGYGLTKRRARKGAEKYARNLNRKLEQYTYEFDPNL